MTITDRPQTEPAASRHQAKGGASRPQIVGGGVLVFIGLIWLLERTGAIDISLTAVLGLATMLIGVSLMLLAKDGAHAGLMVLGAILGLVALLTAAAPFEGFQGGVGDRVIEITSVDEIGPDYNLAIGTLTIDLRDIEGVETGTSLTASVGMGELTVRVPAGTELRVEGRVAVGEFEILGDAEGGLDIQRTFETPGFNPGSPGLTLDVRAFTGRVEVTNE